MDNTDKLDGMSMDIEQTERDKLRAVFPECFTEGKLDIDKLLTMCGEYITDDFEKYSFTWKGKSECLQLAQQRSTACLRPCVEESVDWDTTKNVYIEGDNLEVLKLLQTAYYRKVKMVYIDPPYNTGNDFVYEDDYNEPIANYKRVTTQGMRSNPETAGRYHTNWLNMMYPRLRLGKNLLTDDGVMFISIDEIELPNLRKLCDEIFGEDNHIADFVWHNKRGGGNDAKYVAVEHEYVVMYAKNISELSELFVPYSPEYLTRYKEEDEEGKYFWDTFKRKSGKQYYPIVCPDGTILQYDELGNPISWLRSEPRFKDDLQKGDVRIVQINGRWSVQFKQRLPQGKKPRTIFLEESIWSEQGTTGDGNSEMLQIFSKNLFDNPKPVGLIKHILSFNTSGDDLVCDFFSGSATTAHAVMQLNAEDGGNRRFMLIQLPELCDEKSEAYKAGYRNICEIGKERIRRAGDQLCDKVVVKNPPHRITSWIAEDGKQMRLEESTSTEHWTSADSPPCGIGFRTFKLDTSNLHIWDNTPVGDDMDLLAMRINSMLERVKPDRTDLDIVYEILLKLGQDLCEDVIPVELLDENDEPSGKVAYSIGKDCVILVCLAPDITTEMAIQMGDLAPARIIFGQECFPDVTDMSNARLVLHERGITIRFV